MLLYLLNPPASHRNLHFCSCWHCSPLGCLHLSLSQTISHCFPPKSPARGLFFRCQPHPIAFTTGPNSSMGFPGGSVGKNTGRCGFDPWVEKIPLEGHMETHSSILAWRIPWREEPDGIQSVGPQRVRHNWWTEHALALLLWLPLTEGNI